MPEPRREPDPGYEARVRDSFGKQSHMDTLGVSIAHIAPGEVHLLDFPSHHNSASRTATCTPGPSRALPIQPMAMRPTLWPRRAPMCLAVEFKINLLAPAKATAFLACGRVLRAGRTLTVCLAEVFTARRPERTLIATMLSTIIVGPVVA